MRVLVTGGASGLGQALVQRCADRGDRVLSCDLAEPDDIGPTAGAEDAGVSTAGADEHGQVTQLRLDVRSEPDWADARAWVEEHWGGLDLLVNNAGIAGGGRIELCSLEDWQRIFDVNLFGAVRGTRAFTPLLKAQGSGRIVNVASLAGLVHPPGMGSYNAVKAAVVAFSETTAHELAPFGVGCTAVCPSYFRTNLMTSMRGQDEDLAATMARFVERSEITADDVAAAVLDGVERGEELVLPDGPARAAYALKLTDRPAYDAQMRSIGTRLKERTS